MRSREKFSRWPLCLTAQFAPYEPQSCSIISGVWCLVSGRSRSRTAPRSLGFPTS
jgi:hypothetical protein